VPAIGVGAVCGDLGVLDSLPGSDVVVGSVVDGPDVGVMKRGSRM